MLAFFHFLRGYLTIKVYGYSPERFMNLCSNRNILLWKVEQYKDYYIMNISIKGFFQLRPILRKTKTKVVIIQRYGLPFFMVKMRKRFIFAGGILGCFLFLFIMSLYIWNIEIVGNERVSTEDLMDFLETENIRCGMLKKNIELEQIRRDIRAHYDIIIWNSIKLDGTKLTIHVKEGIGMRKKDDNLNNEIPYDLVSDKEGQIVQMITRKGTPRHKKGDTVSANEILVSGLVPIYTEEGTIEKFIYSKADADIYVRHHYDYNDTIDLNYQEKVLHPDKIQIFFIEMNGKEIRLPHRKNKEKRYDIYTERKQVKLFDNLYLPIYYGKKWIQGYELKNRTHTKEEISQIVNKDFDEFIRSLEEKGVQIIKKDVKIEKNINPKQKTIKIRGSILVIEKIGIVKPANLIKEMDTQNGNL